jgi:hypothetical protein
MPITILLPPPLHSSTSDVLNSSQLNDEAIFCESYNHLVLDPYMGDGGIYRYRRFGSFRYNIHDQRLIYQDNQAFFQSSEHNHLNGGKVRIFAAIEAHIKDNTFLTTLIKHNLSIILQSQYADHWLIYIHQIRIIAQLDTVSKPSPEGIHRDGHAFVAQVLIAKHNVSGAVSHIYNKDKTQIFADTLHHKLDTILLNDNNLYHDVSSISIVDSTIAGYRDMLLIDYNLPTFTAHTH